jgi:eukaryotic-like serine/threonine-protein kinase
VSRSVTLKQGDKLGQYELLTPIGVGGMGRVWAAREGATGLKPRLVAIKTALAEDGATEGFWKVLFDEGRIASQVTHPNVCAIHAVERERGIVYLVMDWSDGGSLRELLDSVTNHRLEFAMAARIVARVCAGLHAVHELLGEDGEPLGVVHRDVSPQNVLISTTGQVRITDFGVAKARGQVHAPTQTGEVKGKIAYMAPEQVTTKDIDRRADVFALGCVLYEATTGQRPFSGTDALATLYALLEQPLIPPSQRLQGYPPALEGIVLRALERNPDDRFQTAEELGRSLEGWLIQEKISVSDADVARALMATLGDRIRVRAAEIEDAVSGIDAPTVVRTPPSEQAHSPSQTTLPGSATLAGSETPMPNSARGSRNLVLALAAGVLVVGGAFAMTRGPSAPATPAAENARPAPAPVAPTPSAVTPAPQATTVKVTFVGEPPSAALVIDGAAVTNPYEGIFPRDSSHTVRAVADGYTDGEETVVLDRDREVKVVLREKPSEGRKPVVRRTGNPVRPATATATPTPTPTPAATPADGMPVIQRKVRTLDNDNPFAKKD